MLLTLVPANAFSNLERLDKTFFYMRWLSLQYKREWTIWLNVLACWAFSIAFYISLRSFSLRVIRLRQAHFSSSTYGLAISHRSIMLTSIPSSLRGYGRLQSYLARCALNPKAYHLSFVGDLDPLRRFFDKHRKALLKAEYLLDKLYKGSRKVESKDRERLERLERKTSRLNEDILQAQAAHSDPTTIQSSTLAFLTFPSVQQAHRALEDLHGHIPYVCFKDAVLRRAPEIQEAPEPNEILWSHASIGCASRRIRSLFSTIISLFLTFFLFGLLYAWVIHLDLTKLLPASAQPMLEKHSFLRSFIDNQITPIAVAIFYHLIPLLSRFLALFKGVPDKRQRDRVILRILFLFFLRSGFTFFLIDVGFDPVNALISTERVDDDGNPAPNPPPVSIIHRLSDPYFLGSVPIILANSLINTSLFWISYMNIMGMGQIFNLLNLPALLLSCQPPVLVRWLHRRRTPREIMEWAKGPKPIHFPLTHTYASILFLFTLTLLFSILTPLILACAVIAFTLTLFALKYRAIYVTHTKHETWGQIWPLVAHRSLVGITLAQIAVMGAINIRRTHPVPTIFLVPLPLCTLAFAFVYRTTLKPQFRYTRDECKKENLEDGMDILIKRPIFPSKDQQECPNHYTPPLLLDQPPVLLISRPMESFVKQHWSGPYEVVDPPLDP
ncbi:hypothetical protein BJ684DRAFT_20704 [Piptocephalis cylindrospora]|uniref:Uncharacterized protein n=1 Tax=Piptocephalis cylindrospora TaxID=1907219 RepID=A0A4P9Y1Y7_9FUNG|nr:hypothetical protein BJ684DRAFT_20704 [Piptocephalis cylindrospora]|eukprot:RKP12773.1 hypothetical protein BJ684DRAFT_20704 [Piptocephalis cylindrospora]